MKCPKCHYLSFEPEPRCRNCGYDLELVAPDLEMRQPAAETPLSDLRLRGGESDAVAEPPVAEGGLRLVADAPIARAQRSAPRAPAASRSRSVALLEDPPPARTVARSAPPAEVSSAPLETALSAPKAIVFPAALVEPGTPGTPGTSGSSTPSSTGRTTAELPLFIKAMAETTTDSQESDEPLIGVPVAPRPPLSVRRRHQEPARPAPTPELRTFGPMEKDFVDDLARLDREKAEQERAEARALVRAAQGDLPGEAATPVRRLAAATVDAGLLAAITIANVAMTLRLCGLSFAELGILPMLPLATFSLLISAGYLLLFTVASGQTIGKMCLGLRVVGAAGSTAEGTGDLTPRQAASRALLTLPSVIALGLGFLPALLGRQALHDRLSETRVVRA